MQHPMTPEERNRQIRKEALATFLLFLICLAWNVGFAYGLSGCPITVFHLPLWWVLSTPGVFVVAVAGVVFLLKKVFVNFEFEEEEEETEETL